MMLVTISIYKENIIYVTNITPSEAAMLCKMLLLYSLGIQLTYFIRNLIKVVKCLLSVAQTFILLFFLSLLQ